jgi:hypothetical protein
MQLQSGGKAAFIRRYTAFPLSPRSGEKEKKN